MPRNLSEREPHVVATVHTVEGLRLAQKLKTGAVDFIEIRVDALEQHPVHFERELARIKFPLICTVRDPAEGGVGELNVPRRRELYARVLPFATFIDVELRSLKKLSSTVAAARAGGVGVIASFHDFKTTPGLDRLVKLLDQAADSGAEIFKVAATANSAVQFATLMDFIASPARIPVSAMGMGKFGKVSRLALAAAGSVLNYGFIDKAAASGQWPAALLKERIAELRE